MDQFIGDNPRHVLAVTLARSRLGVNQAISARRIYFQPWTIYAGRDDGMGCPSGPRRGWAAY